MPSMHDLFLVTTFFYSLVMTASPSNETRYASCGSRFSCGGIKNISYPFAGGDRPDHCGLPAFKLTCRDNTTTLLTNSSATLRVLDINQSEKTLTLARDDLYNTTCPSRFFNTTLNYTIFVISDQDDILTLIYGCNSLPMPLKPPNQFTCRVRNVDFSDAYSILGPVPTDPVLGFMYYCSVSVTVPMLREVGKRLTSGVVSLGEALMEGFYVNYSDPYEMMCRECRKYGGECGFDSNLGAPLCVCGDRLCSLSLPPQSPREYRNDSMVLEDNNKKSAALIVGLPIAGAVIAGIVISWLVLFCRKRRKRAAAMQASLSGEAVSKEIRTSTSSKPLMSHTSSAFTKSIPSYPTSKSGLGRGSSYFGVQIFNYSELEEATDNFSPSRELGDGGFGAVYYGTLADGRVVAVKRLYENNFRRQEQFMNEVEILARLRHENLVHLYGCTSKRSRDLLLVYEYIPNGTVADHLHGSRAKSGLLLWPVRLKIAIETAEALAYLHKSDIIHRDVKTTNILLDDEFHVKVADFGLSRLFPDNVTHVSTAPQGTPGYVDPEYYQVYRLTEKSDVFSFGVVLIELISSLQAVDINRHRTDINLANMALNKIQNHAVHELVDQSLGFETNNFVRKTTSLVAELAFRCLQQEREIRPSMQEVLEALKGIENGEMKSEKEGFVEIMVDDVALLKGNIDTPSPDSAGKSAESSTPHSL